ncbi:hypothetical protein AB0N61_15245 [Microbacterium sp. NPDC089320]|uniref:hypothetical protein n=1 Tax=Microbacterium sp. NPDC089320 TaxID=3155182 RepID=UPI00342E70DF
MGLFQQRTDDEENQWKLPSEPLERSESDVLSAATAVDPLTLGLGLDSPAVSSIVFPVAPPAPEATSIENGEPDPETETETETD